MGRTLMKLLFLELSEENMIICLKCCFNGIDKPRHGKQVIDN